MQLNIISYTLILFLMVMFFLSLIYAPWTEIDPPRLPSPEYIRKTCVEWIHFSGFALENYRFNRGKAMSRDLNYDRYASKWAAGYAFKIGGIEEIYQITPQEFCASFGNNNSVPMRFRALGDEIESCKGWIKLYGFSENDVGDNILYARNTPLTKAQYMSIYAYDYWLFLRRPGDRSNLNPSEYCSKIGVHEYHGFECPNTAYITCMEWLRLYDYENFPDRILEKADALARNMGNYPLRIHFFPDLYGFDLLKERNNGRSEQEINRFTAFQFCLPYQGDYNAPLRYSFYFKHLL